MIAEDSRASLLPLAFTTDRPPINVGRTPHGSLITDDNFFSPSPALRRAVDEAGRALTDMGAHVETISLPDMAEAMQLYFGLISADGAANLIRTLGRSRADWRIRRFVRIARLPRSLRAAVIGLLSAAGQKGMAELVGWSGSISADRYWQITHGRTEFTRRFVQRLDTARLDAILLPPHALPALTHGSTMHLPAAASYCFLANLLGMPAGVLPVTRVRPGEESDRLPNRDAVVRDARRVEQGRGGRLAGWGASAWRRPLRGEDVVLAVMGAAGASVSSARADFPRPPIE